MRWKVSMEKRKRRKFTDELKREAVRLVREGASSVGQVARELDVVVSALRHWVKQDKIQVGKPAGIETAETAGLIPKGALHCRQS